MSLPSPALCIMNRRRALRKTPRLRPPSKRKEIKGEDSRLSRLIYCIEFRNFSQLTRSCQPVKLSLRHLQSDLNTKKRSLRDNGKVFNCISFSTLKFQDEERFLTYFLRPFFRVIFFVVMIVSSISSSPLSPSSSTIIFREPPPLCVRVAFD